MLDHQETLPGAGQYAAQFLNVIRERTLAADIGLSFEARKSGQYVTLVAALPVGRRVNMGSRPELHVFSEPVGSSLNIGWQVIREVQAAGGGLLGAMSPAWSRAANRAALATEMFDNDPQRVRAVQGTVNAFHRLVFDPTLEDLSEALEGKLRG